jgi:S1-C subfamily serine protease
VSQAHPHHFPHLPDWLVYGAVVAGLLAAAIGRQERADAPEPPPPVGGEEQAPIAPTGPFGRALVTKVSDRRRVEVGTAFSIGDRGQWVTARHVVAGCREVALIVAEGRGVLAKVRTDPPVDLAVLQTEGGAPGLPLATSEPTIGERGFHPGFPNGRAGEATSRFLGRELLPARRRGEAEQTVLAWAETGRTRGVHGALSGLSGAPVLNAQGAVVGVTLAEQPRRGRIYTTLPGTLAHTLAKARLTPTAAPLTDPVTVDNYFRVADTLRRDVRVAQVICLT